MTMSAADVDALAAALIGARAKGAEPLALPKVVPADIAVAYRVQDAVLARLGPAAGWKVGAPNPTAEPLCAPILKGQVLEVSDKAIAVPAKSAIEVEIAFRMVKAFPAAARAPSEADVVAAIGSAHIAMELCASRLADWAGAPMPLNIADNQANFALVLGPKVADWRGIDAATQTAAAYVDGKAVAETTGGHAHKGLLKLLVWQVGHCVTRRGGLPAGAVITTGSWTGIHWLERPARVGASFARLGRMDVVLTAM